MPTVRLAFGLLAVFAAVSNAQRDAIADGDEVLGLEPNAIPDIPEDECPEWLFQRYPPRAIARLHRAGWVATAPPASNASDHFGVFVDLTFG